MDTAFMLVLYYITCCCCYCLLLLFIRYGGGKSEECIGRYSNKARYVIATKVNPWSDAGNHANRYTTRYVM